MQENNLRTRAKETQIGRKTNHSKSEPTPELEGAQNSAMNEIGILPLTDWGETFEQEALVLQSNMDGWISHIIEGKITM